MVSTRTRTSLILVVSNCFSLRNKGFETWHRPRRPWNQVIRVHHGCRHPRPLPCRGKMAYVRKGVLCDLPRGAEMEGHHHTIPSRGTHYSCDRLKHCAGPVESKYMDLLHGESSNSAKPDRNRLYSNFRGPPKRPPGTTASSIVWSLKILSPLEKQKLGNTNSKDPSSNQRPNHRDYRRQQAHHTLSSGSRVFTIRTLLVNQDTTNDTLEERIKIGQMNDNRKNTR